MHLCNMPVAVTSHDIITLLNTGRDRERENEAAGKLCGRHGETLKYCRS